MDNKTGCYISAAVRIISIALLLILLAISAVPVYGWQENPPATTPEPEATSTPVPCSYETNGICFRLVNSTSERPAIDPLWWKSNAINQINQQTLNTAIKLIDIPFNTCGPTTLAMMTNYLGTVHPRPEIDHKVTPSEIMLIGYDRFGFYTSESKDGLLSLAALQNVAENVYGLKQPYPEDKSLIISWDTMLEGLRMGYPAIVGARYTYDKESRYVFDLDALSTNHFIIVFGIVADENGNEWVWIVNTHPGKLLREDSDVTPMKISLDTFQKIWGSYDSILKEYDGQALFLD